MVDVGAYIGNHTVFFGKVCKARKVWAIEPNRTAFHVLQRNLRLNDLEKTVCPLNLALGKTGGHGQLIATAENDGGSSIIGQNDQGDIDIVALDSLITSENQVHLIKIDVEGMELEVLQGADQLLRKYHPILYIEAQRPSDLQAVASYLNPYEYQPQGYFGRTPTYLFR